MKNAGPTNGKERANLARMDRAYIKIPLETIRIDLNLLIKEEGWTRTQENRKVLPKGKLSATIVER